MNLIAVDIGNTNITLALFLEGKETTIESIPGESTDKITETLKSLWQQVPVMEISTEKKRNGVIVVSSVKPEWTKTVKKIAMDQLGERIRLSGKDIPLPMPMFVDDPTKVGTDRVVTAAAAFDVVEAAVVVIDFGTALTIDLVDENGVFQGGIICPGFDVAATALHTNTAQLPKVKVSKPEAHYGKNTNDAINCGLYYSAIATIQEVTRRYAETLGQWPQTVITGSAAKIIKDDCKFIDSWVPNLVVKGIALAYRKYIEEKTE